MMQRIQKMANEIKKKQLELLYEIGRGAFGVVYKGRWSVEIHLAKADTS